MKVATLVALFFVLFLSEMLDIELSLFTGLSFKNAVLYGILLYLILSSAIQRSSPFAGAGLPMLSFTLLIVYAFLSWLLAPTIGLTPDYPAGEKLLSLKSVLIDQFLFFLIYYALTDSQASAVRILRAIFFLVVISSVITVIDTLDIPDLGLIKQRPNGVVSGPLGESNQYAAFMVLFTPGVIAISFTATRVTRVFWWVGVFACCGALLLTTSRGAVVGTIGGIFIGGLALRRFIDVKRAALVLSIGTVMIVAAVGIASLKYSDLLTERFVNKATSGDIFVASSGRSMIWETAFRELSEEPAAVVFGFGWDSFHISHPYDMHNTFFGYLYNLGTIGLLLYLFLIFNVFSLIRRGVECAAPMFRPQLIAHLFGYLSMFVALFFVSLFKPWYFIWAYTGVIAKMAVLACRDDFQKR